MQKNMEEEELLLRNFEEQMCFVDSTSFDLME